MITPENALGVIPDQLRIPLIEEYRTIVINYFEHRWLSSELRAGRFCEIVYSILDGYASGVFPTHPSKPNNFVDACRRLENNPSVPRSFQILIPRLLPALYEIRNNRNVGHVGGDVVPDLMDCTAVVTIASWILAEMIRVLHNSTTEEAQNLVNSMVEQRIPIVWKSGNTRRILYPSIKLKDQMLILIASNADNTNIDELHNWLEYNNKSYLYKVLHNLHKARLIECNFETKSITILPPGTDYVATIVSKYI